MDKEKSALYQTASLFLMVMMVVLTYSLLWGSLKSEQYPTKTISVNASGKSIAKPDVARISFSIVSEGKTSSEVSDKNNEVATKAISFLKDQGIDEKDIRTTEYSLNPVYSQAYGLMSSSFVPSIEKYSLTQGIAVKVRDFSKMSSIMEKLTSLGVNRFGGVSFIVDDQEKYQEEARAEALEKAKAKAQQVAQEAGISLGDLVNVSDYPNTASVGGYEMMKSSDYSVRSAGIAPTLEAGSQEVSVNVSLTYEIR